MNLLQLDHKFRERRAELYYVTTINTGANAGNRSEGITGGVTIDSLAFSYSDPKGKR